MKAMSTLAKTKKIKLRLSKEQMDFLTYVKNKNGDKSYSETVNVLLKDFLDCFCFSLTDR